MSICVSWYDSPVEYNVTYKIASNICENGMTHISICGLMQQGTTQYEDCEDIACYALNLLQDELVTNVVFYNSLAATQYIEIKLCYFHEQI